MRDQKESKAERVDWVIPVGSGVMDSRRLKLERVLDMSKHGIIVTVNADNPEETFVAKLIVKDMPAPNKLNWK